MFKLNLFDPAAVQTTGTETLSAEIKTYYEKQLLRNAEPNLVHDQFGKKFTIPQGSGHSIEFRKFTPLSKKASAITEGVTPDGSTLTVTTVSATLYQYGDYIRTSDRLDIEAIDPIISETSKLQGAQAGLTLNQITKTELATATNKVFAGGKAARANLTTSDVLDIATIYKAVATLRAQNAPTINGEYVGIIHPWVANDLMMAVSASPAWVDVNKYANPESIFKGEIGKIGGVRFVSSSEAKIWNDNTCPAISGSSPTAYYSVFQTLILGSDAYAVTDLSGMGLEYIVKPLGYADALNQVASMGWKAMKAAKILNNNFMVSIESCSATNSTASAN